MKDRKSPSSADHFYSDHSAHSLKKHGKSFYFASFFLYKDTAHKAARLYHFCRILDDIVDESNASDSKTSEKLDRIASDLKRGQGTSDLTRDFLDMAQEQDIDINAALYLIDGVREDQKQVRIKTQADLIQYCYKVAGVVGLMMCPVLGVKDRKAFAYAIDMGIAMQLTNIARDVLEDAQNGRRYIPSTMAGDLDVTDILKSKEIFRNNLQNCVCQILDIADRYYQSGFDGLAYLPPRSRLAIMIAAKVYRQIGTVIKANDCDIWQGRAYVSFPRKLTLAGGGIIDFGKLSLSLPENQPVHDSDLHLNLQGFPGAHPPDLKERLNNDTD